MTVMTQTKPDQYVFDQNGRVAAVSDEGLRLEKERGEVAGGGMFNWAASSTQAMVVVLVAPSMPNRFKAIEITDSDVFLIRTDDVRCRVNCDPTMADGFSEHRSMKVTEASGQPNGENIEYEIDVVAMANAPAMMM